MRRLNKKGSRVVIRARWEEDRTKERWSSSSTNFTQSGFSCHSFLIEIEQLTLHDPRVTFTRLTFHCSLIEQLTLHNTAPHVIYTFHFDFSLFPDRTNFTQSTSSCHIQFSLFTLTFTFHCSLIEQLTLHNPAPHITYTFHFSLLPDRATNLTLSDS